ncbi:MAG: hypothetical protein OXC98_10360 [bacterium]|nr:hypothetical protein [bacterium]
MRLSRSCNQGIRQMQNAARPVCLSPERGGMLCLLAAHGQYSVAVFGNKLRYHGAYTVTAMSRGKEIHAELQFMYDYRREPKIALTA